MYEVMHIRTDQEAQQRGLRLSDLFGKQQNGERVVYHSM